MPTPNAGGLAFVIPVVFLEIISSNYYPLICTPLAIIGAVDDRKSVSSLIRFSMQMLTVLIIVLLNLNNLIELSYFNVFTRITLYFIFVLIGTAIINFINFMDGIDGIISINAAIFFAFIAFFLNSNYYIILFSLLAFLYFNWNPAKIFMGDVGSNFIGTILFISLFEAKDGIDFIFLILVFFPIFADAFILLLRRLKAKQNFFKPHKKHLYQRLVQSGWSHTNVSLLYALATFCCAFFYFNFGAKLLIFTIACIIIIGWFLDTKYALPFK